MQIIGLGNGAFDPQTLVLLETAFDEAWLTLKSTGNKTVKPDELARPVLHLAIEGGTRSRSITRRGAGGTATRWRLARGELIVACPASRREEMLR
jgi:hypothetical protein